MELSLLSSTFLFLMYFCLFRIVIYIFLLICFPVLQFFKMFLLISNWVLLFRLMWFFVNRNVQVVCGCTFPSISLLIWNFSPSVGMEDQSAFFYIWDWFKLLILIYVSALENLSDTFGEALPTSITFLKKKFPISVTYFYLCLHFCLFVFLSSRTWQWNSVWSKVLGW